MNRRWIVLLVIVMLAALAPSSALAGKLKAMDEITKITWTSLGDGLYNGTCASNVTVQYTVAKGAPRRYEILIMQGDGYLQAAGNKVERDGEVSRNFNETTYYDPDEQPVVVAPAWVRVRLIDNKSNSVAQEQTLPYQFSAGSCPPTGTSLGA
jgi:hypothetical protein